MGNNSSLDAILNIESNNYWVEKARKDPHTICIVPREILESNIGSEICLATVKQFGVYLKFVPEKHKTFSLCVEAVRNCKASLLYVPESMHHEVKQSAENLRTLDLCKDDETKNPELLCASCLEKMKRVRFDCGHVSVCISCSEKIDKCPICRQKKVNPLIVYL